MSFINYKSSELSKNSTDEKLKKEINTLNESDVNILTMYSSNQKEISIPSLIDLVLLNIKGKSIKNENIDELLMFGMVTKDGMITKNAKTYLESDNTKERLKTILK